MNIEFTTHKTLKINEKELENKRKKAGKIIKLAFAKLLTPYLVNVNL